MNIFEEAAHGRADASDTKMLTDAVVDGWRTLLFAALGLTLVLGFLGDKIHSGGGVHTVVGAVCLFVAGFCLGGEFDAVIRQSRARRVLATARLGDAELPRTDPANGIGLAIEVSFGIAAVLIYVFGF